MSGRGGPVGQTNTVRVQLPLLDRLIDDAPDRDRDPPMSAAETMQQSAPIGAAGTGGVAERAPPLAIPAARTDRTAAVAGGLWHSGFRRRRVQRPGRRDRLRLEIEATIRRFEPRFLSVRVHLTDDEQRLDASLRLRIEAVLHAEPAPEQVTFDTIVDTVNDNVRIRANETI